jgi:hypothetical protein
MFHAFSAHAAEDTVSEEARAHFKAGVALLQDPDGARVEEAYREFRTAYAMSNSPKILGNMGYCAMKLERDAEAIDAYSRYLREVPDVDADERAQIVRDLQTLSVGIVRVNVSVSQPGALVSDVRIPVRGDKITNVYTPEAGKLALGVRAGHHVFTVRAQGFQEATWELDALAGVREQHEFVLKKVEAAPVTPPSGSGTADKKSGPGILPWIVTGVGVAAIGAGTATGIVALGKSKDIENACPGNVCPRRFDLEGKRSQAATFVTATDFLLIGGSVLTAGGLTWWFLTRTSDEQPAQPAAPPANASAMCTKDGCFGSASVSF